MKSILTIGFILITLSAPRALANDFGSLEKADLLSLSEERVHNLISNSAEVRKSLSGGRNLAGFTAEDEKWASEYENLMNNQDDVDYLELASQL